ncbi:MAG: Mth938-like domain-containing protein [Steroidobacteraceae bacterium]|nr:Mth938-like domain-containing protein [Steroidobacteraceae bacterium]
MKFSSDARPDALLVRSYSARELRAAEHVFTSSVILSADHHVADWPPRSPEDLTVEHLAAILALEPEVVLLGTGTRQVFPDPKLFAHMASRGIGFEVMDTGAACRTYNVLVNEYRKVVLAVLIARE